MSFRSLQSDREHGAESIDLHRQLYRQRSNSTPIPPSHCASGDVNAKDSKGRTLLFYAAKYGQTEIARQLLDAGCDPNIADHNRNTPLHEASDGSHIDIVKLLIKYDCDVNAKNLQGQTAMMRAVLFDDIDIVKLLHKAGTNVEKTDCTGKTALLIGLQEGREKSCVYLIKQGCDVHIIDKLGQSALCLAQQIPNQFSSTFYKKLMEATEDQGKDFNHSSKSFSEKIQRCRKSILKSINGLKSSNKKTVCTVEFAKQDRDTIDIPSFSILDISR